ncbi:hypothetical protein SAMN04488540_103214 [Ferrimonas sediminum]|uniref:Uncharacterized protein n=1 Tax=Ferrimonas sediminum TaxID=718193 RepID=A0A1G8NRR9_9GAMM|nr:hypothetical protein [Ferrimonas sediminum]SDI82971.1 hypothetical protein SAMN04488540_103214 [Ferrimonas sediminum]
MTKTRVIVTLLLVLVVAAVLVAIRPNTDLTLNCRNELHDSQSVTGDKHYLIVDVALKDDLASMSFRYFSKEGVVHSQMLMTGSVVSTSVMGDAFELAIDHIDTQYHQPEALQVQHIQYLEAFAKSNLANLGVHNLTIRLLENNEQAGYALFFLQPSNSVVACRVVE